MKTYLSWVKLMTKLPISARKEWVKCVLDGIKSYRNGTTRKNSVWFSDVITDDREFELVGFAANVSYVKVEGSKEEIDALYVHPWGTPTLLLKHKRLPMLVMASPSIRLDDSIYREMGNTFEAVRGFTG